VQGKQQPVIEVTKHELGERFDTMRIMPIKRTDSSETPFVHIVHINRNPPGKYISPAASA
jgi:hypothetical protein